MSENPFDRLSNRLRSFLKKPPAPAPGAPPSERRALPRFSQKSLEEDPSTPRLFVKSGGREVAARLFDVSKRGLCFETEAPLDGDVQAVFWIDTTGIPLALRPVNRNGARVGCLIIDASPLWLTEAAKLLDPLEMGRRLREIDRRFLQQNQPGQTLRWFQGGPGCDMFIWSTPRGDVERAQLVFDWKVVEWTAAQALRTGRVEEPPVDKGERGHPMAQVYNLAAPPDKEVLTQARRLLRAAQLPPEIVQVFN